MKISRSEGLHHHDQLPGKELSKTYRSLAPAHFLMKIEKYSLMSDIKKHESSVFDAGGYKWRLLLYLSGDKENGGENHISLYLEIVETDSFPTPWEVNVNLKIFVHDQIHDNYLVIQDLENGGIKRFHALKTTWGFTQLLPIKTLKESSKGYIVSDSCVFGAEVFVVKHTGRVESLTLIKSPCISGATFTWEIEKFSELDNDSYNSKVFSVGGRNWTLRIGPKGDIGQSQRGKSLSMFLTSHWKTQIPTKAGVHTEYILRIIDQINGIHYGRQATSYFSIDNPAFGYSNMIPLEDLRKSSRGFIVKDSLTVEVEIKCLLEIKC